MLTIDEIRATLHDRPHEPTGFESHPGQAAVAMILADGENDLEVCFIRRAECSGDPWSGQVAFPGGRAGPSDRSASAVAQRETFEEIGLELKTYNRVGPLPIQPIEHQELKLLSPFVYYVSADMQATATVRERHEVASVFWMPLHHLFDEAAATELEYPSNGAVTRFPRIRYGEYVIWGLTLRVLESFAEIMRRNLAVRPGLLDQ